MNQKKLLVKTLKRDLRLFYNTKKRVLAQSGSEETRNKGMEYKKEQFEWNFSKKASFFLNKNCCGNETNEQMNK